MNNTTSYPSKQNVVYSFLLLFLLLIGVGSVIYFIVKSLQPQVAAAFVAAGGTVFVSVVSVLVAKHYERQAEIQREHMKRKAEIYERQIEFWFGILFAAKMGKSNPDEKELMRFFHDTIKDLITWGSDNILRSYRDFQKSASSVSNADGQKKMIQAFEALLFEMRKDLGHSCSGLGTGDILRMFITDYDEKF